MTAGRPAEWVAEAAAELGTSEVALRCAALLRGGEDPDLLPVLAGRAVGLARSADYWPRVWGARGLRYAWDDRAAPAVVDALRDSAWRVREMAAKVALQHELSEAADVLAAMSTDAIPRVRAAAAAALGLLGEAEHADALHELEEDPEATVRRRAQHSLRTLARRLDRNV